MSENEFYAEFESEDTQKQQPLPEKLFGKKQNYTPVHKFRGYCGGYTALADDGTLVFVKRFDSCNKKYRDAIYLNEARFIPLLAKEGITPKLLDQGLYEPLIIQPFIEGQNLEDHISHNELPSSSKTREIAIPLFKTAQKMHDHHITHRDLKSANIIIPHTGNSPNYKKPYIIDFGFAKRTGELDHLSDLFGTLNYQAPEQMMGGTVDNRTDIYAGGIILHEILTGDVPFNISNRPQLYRAKRKGPIKLEIEDERIAQALSKATEPDPQKRHQSFNEFIEAMQKRKFWGWLAPKVGL